MSIYSDVDFMGRVSLSLDLHELPLDKCDEFFRTLGGAAGQRMSAPEKARILCVTGGVPRYLEEIDYASTAEANIVDLCFTRGGILVDEFDRIFNDRGELAAGIEESGAFDELLPFEWFLQ
jgi:hypothetical protein